MLNLIEEGSVTRQGHFRMASVQSAGLQQLTTCTCSKFLHYMLLCVDRPGLPPVQASAHHYNTMAVKNSATVLKLIICLAAAFWKAQHLTR